MFRVTLVNTYRFFSASCKKQKLLPRVVGQPEQACPFVDQADVPGGHQNLQTIVDGIPRIPSPVDENDSR